MRAEIICVGTELLLGNIVNVNGAYLAERLVRLGVVCDYLTTVGDDRDRILETLEIATKRSDVVILVGGIGGTTDDITRETLAEFTGRKLYLDERSQLRMQIYFTSRGLMPTKSSEKQVYFPEGAEIFDNNQGTAPGFALKTKECSYILLPGTPVQMRAMYEETVDSYLEKLSKGSFVSGVVKLCGITEGVAEETIADLLKNQKNPTIALYSRFGEVHIRVTAAAPEKKEAAKLIKPVIKELKQRFGNFVYTTDEGTTLEKSLVDLLAGAQLTISCAESCTGGMLSSMLINVPGVSDIFKSGLVTYSNKAKRVLLGVKKSTLQKYGAVSEQTAREMVKGLLGGSKTDVGISVTGIAGPDGGTKEKPVGLVYIACSVKGNVVVKECHFRGNREQVRSASCAAALMLARESVLEYLSKVTFGK